MVENAEELNNRVQLLMAEENWGGAIAVLESHPRFVEKHAELSWNLGWAYFKEGDWETAQQHLSHAVKLGPTRAASWWALGAAQHEGGKLHEAEQSLKEALLLRDSSICRQILALVLMTRGKIAEAEQIHLKGLELKPESPERWEVYGCFLEDVGRRADADAAYKKARLLTGS
jgi:Tfp pilus assembly protein PilF